MPTADTILTGLTATANDWQWLAVGWHVALALLAASLARGWRPSVRTVGVLLAAPVASVGAVALLSGNPFNGALFLVLTAGLVRAATRQPDGAVQFDTPAWIVRGGAVVVFGAVYPHFLRTDSWAAYLVASPFGLLPCPTLLVVIGLTTMLVNLRSPLWTRTLLAAGALYASIGVFGLRVELDWALFVATALLGGQAVSDGRAWRSVRADRRERGRPLAGDAVIANPSATLTHAITVTRPPAEVWPWLVQMGAGSRAGWYSYDFLDNGRRPSATRVVPELQAIGVGTLFPALPGVTDGFKVLALEPNVSLVLGWPGPEGVPTVTWAFVLEPRADRATRLIVRVRAGQGYRFRGLHPRLSKPLIEAVHFVMQRRQLLGIARRAEAADADPLLTRFIPEFDVVERHQIRVAAPAETTLAAAREQDLYGVPLIRAIFRLREILMRATPGAEPEPRGLLAAMQSIGWGILAAVPGREVVVGAVTKPWEADVTFRALPPADFAAFAEPGFVKIVWTLRADPIDGESSIFRTETRAVATDATARKRFRRYWTFVSPGIVLIRRLALRPLKRDAERRARARRVPALDRPC